MSRPTERVPTAPATRNRNTARPTRNDSASLRKAAQAYLGPATSRPPTGGTTVQPSGRLGGGMAGSPSKHATSKSPTRPPMYRQQVEAPKLMKVFAADDFSAPSLDPSALDDTAEQSVKTMKSSPTLQNWNHEFEEQRRRKSGNKTSGAPSPHQSDPQNQSSISSPLGGMKPTISNVSNQSLPPLNKSGSGMMTPHHASPSSDLMGELLTSTNLEPGVTANTPRPKNSETGGSRRNPVPTPDQRQSPIRLTSSHKSTSVGKSSYPAIHRLLEESKQLPVDSVLSALERLREECVSSGRFQEAQRCVDEMKSLAIAESKNVVRQLEQKHSNAVEVREQQDEHRRQLLQFTSLWETALKDFEANAAEELRKLKSRHAREFSEQEDILRSQLSSRRPHFSKHVMRARESMETLVEQRQYNDAHMVQQSLNKMEEEETRRFEERLSMHFARQTKQMKHKMQLEVQSVQHRLDASRDTLVAQRRQDFELLLQRQMNQRTELEQKRRSQFKRKQHALNKKVEVLASSKASAKAVRDSDFDV